MQQYYDLVMAETLSRYVTDAKVKEKLPGIAPEGASEDERWEAMKSAFYGTDYAVISEWGLIDFDPLEWASLHGGKGLPYYEYLDVMRHSANNAREDFVKAYYDGVFYTFKGRVERINRKKRKICFERIFIDAQYRNNEIECFCGKEDHVWMDLNDFPSCQKGNCFAFTADIYRYIKTGNGKMIDFGLRNPEDIHRIEDYELPTDEELRMQSIDEIICTELCLFREHCYGFCIADEEWRNDMRAVLSCGGWSKE